MQRPSSAKLWQILLHRNAQLNQPIALPDAGELQPLRAACAPELRGQRCCTLSLLRSENPRNRGELRCHDPGDQNRSDDGQRGNADDEALVPRKQEGQIEQASFRFLNCLCDVFVRYVGFDLTRLLKRLFER